MTDHNYLSTVKHLCEGGLVAMPTDTLWGLLGSALQPDTVEKIYQLRERDKAKPFITLIADLADLQKFGVTITLSQQTKLARWWPGPVSVILGSSAFRLPALPWLQALLAETGPLVAPSANLAGQPPATNLAEARAYFGDQVAYYQPELSSADSATEAPLNQPSTLVKLAPDGTYQILRPGAGDAIVTELNLDYKLKS